MAWKYCKKDEAASFSGLDVSKFHDFMSAIVEEMIDDYEGKSFGDAVQYIESYDGNGTDTLFVNNVPIVAVTSLAVDGSSVSTSEYKVYDHYIRLVSSSGSRIKTAMGDVGSSFPVGQQNVTVTYTANQATIPGRVRFCAIQMLTVIALMSERGGSDTIIPMTRAGQEFGSNRTLSMDVSKKLRTVMDNTLKEKMLFA